MKEPQGPHTVLIVDDDVAFVWWLGETFTEADYQPVPALNSTEARSLIDSLDAKVNVLVVNPALPAVAALVESLESADRDLKVVLIQDGRTSKAPRFRYDATLARPRGWEPVSREDWLRKLRTLLKQLEAAPHR